MTLSKFFIELANGGVILGCLLVWLNVMCDFVCPFTWYINVLRGKAKSERPASSLPGIDLIGWLVALLCSFFTGDKTMPFFVLLHGVFALVSYGWAWLFLKLGKKAWEKRKEQK